MPIPRSVLTAVFLVVGVVLASPGAAVAREDPVKELRRSAEEAKDELKKAAEAMGKRKKDLAASQDKLRATLKELAKAEAALDRIREPVARLANAAYQQPGTGSMSIIGAGDASQALRATADMAHVARAQRELVQSADRLQGRRQRLATTAQELQSRNAVEKTRLQQEIDALKKRSEQLTGRLTAKLKKIEKKRRKRLLKQCDRSGADNARNYPNGLIPDRYLCPLPQKGEQLRADAALAFYKLNAAYKRRFGRDMCVTDSYRPLAEQQRLYSTRPAGYAAVPGTSNHGKGQALDLCGGVENASTAQFNWLEANSKEYGWFHPAWAYSNPYEPWHWEYGQESDA